MSAASLATEWQLTFEINSREEALSSKVFGFWHWDLSPVSTDRMTIVLLVHDSCAGSDTRVVTPVPRHRARLWGCKNDHYARVPIISNPKTRAQL